MAGLTLTSHQALEPRDMQSLNQLRIKQEVVDNEFPLDMSNHHHHPHLHHQQQQQQQQHHHHHHQQQQHHHHQSQLSQEQPEPGMFNDLAPNDQGDVTYHDVQDFKLKGSDGKLIVPAILTKGQNQTFQLIDSVATPHPRAKREFVPDSKKDANYWSKRIKNNDSARRSRVKRKTLEKMMESRLMDLQKENIELRHEIKALRRRFGLEDTDPADQTVPTPSGEKQDSSDSEMTSPLPIDSDSRSQDDFEMVHSVDTSRQRSFSDATNAHFTDAGKRVAFEMRERSQSDAARVRLAREKEDGAGSGHPQDYAMVRRNSDSITSGEYQSRFLMTDDVEVVRSARIDDAPSELQMMQVMPPYGVCLNDSPGDYSSQFNSLRDSSSPDSQTSSGHCSTASSISDVTQGACEGDARGVPFSSKEFKNFPLKCRLKHEMHSAFLLSTSLGYRKK